MTVDAMAKAYEPGDVQKQWYEIWESRGYFRGNPDTAKETYTIVIPPPNVTGMLTLGHVLNNTLQDILIRWKKMEGREVCWVPGTDHAGIATQSKVEAFLKSEESLTRFDLGREKFLERVWEWKEKYGGTIIRQLRSLGVACDWPRECFTLDESLSNAVTEVFIRLYDKGLIYRGTRMINWCPKSHTALSDEEVIYRTVKGSLWHFRYPLTDGSGHIIVATTRPETMLGDSGIAVHPRDDRYSDLIGKTVTLPIMDREIPIFADDFVDQEFGTGAVKVTPAHDPNDYEMAGRHNLAIINIMNDDGSMNENAGEQFRNLDRYECRKRVVEILQSQDLIDKIEDYENKIGYSERGHVPVEPRISKQWFVNMKTLAEPALRVVNDGEIRFHPPRWIKTYNHWMENIKDWCISRQLWWGHRIPAYYCDQCDEIVVSRNQPTQCPACNCDSLHQDEDVLDTWFSSWLWPFTVFKWPDNNPDLSKFYPTQSLVTGPDIIFFWVARMIMSGLEFTGKIPFSDVYFTSIIRDNDGRKLSKSLNNSPDPLEVIDAYGADALRYTVIYIAPVGQDLRYSNEKCEIGRNFANKIWNAARFRQLQGGISPNWRNLEDLHDVRPDDRWILARANATIVDVTTSLGGFDFHSYSIQLYEFVWNEFCDWYVESAKAAFYGENQEEKARVLRIFDFVFSIILRLMHPVMPFITEEIYHQLGFIAEDDSIMLAEWPAQLNPETIKKHQLTQNFVDLIQDKFDLIKAGRNLRGPYNIPFNRKISYVIKPLDSEFEELLEADPESVRVHLNASSITINGDYSPEGLSPSAVGKHGLIYMPLTGLIDIDAEMDRLNKQKADIVRLIDQINSKLNNQNFVERAPDHVVDGERRKHREFREKLDRVDALLAELSR